MEEIVTCPISKEIFFDPVIASDGHTYERSMIVQWLNKNKNSPITREPITNVLIDNNIVKKIVNECMVINPQLTQNIFKPPYNFYNELIIKKLNNKCFDVLLQYNITHEFLTSTDICGMSLVRYVFINCKDSVILKHVVDNMNNLEFIFRNGARIIHYICEFSPPEMIKYIIDKGVDLECETIYKWHPIHFICRYSTPEMIKYIIDKGVDLECETDNDKWRPIHFICRYSTLEIVKYIVDKSVNLTCVTTDEPKFIDLVVKNNTPDIVEYLNKIMC